VRVSDWRMRSFGPLNWTFTEVPRENAITVGAFVAIRQVGQPVALAQVVTLAAETGLAARIATRTRPHRLMSSPLDWVLTIATFERHSIIPRYRPINHRRNFVGG
jgi:hypothetical protein